MFLIGSNSTISKLEKNKDYVYKNYVSDIMFLWRDELYILRTVNFSGNDVQALERFK